MISIYNINKQEFIFFKSFEKESFFMKKLIAFAVSAMLIATLSLTAFAEQVEISVPKATTAPVIDGVVNEGEYKLISGYAGEESTVWSVSGANAKSRKVDFYASWDDTNFYVAVVADCAPTHVQINEGENYIFNAHHLMSAATATNPTEDQYKPAEGTAWDWSAAFASNLGREWSIAMKSTDNTLIVANHFGPVVEFPYIVKATGGKDIYEQAIPWTAIDLNAANKFVTGAKFGYAFAVGVGDVSTDVANGVDAATAGDYVNFAKGINGYKNFAEYSVVTLADVEAAAEVPADETTTDETKDNPETSDAVSEMFALIAVAFVAGFVLVKKSHKA